MQVKLGKNSGSYLHERGAVLREKDRLEEALVFLTLSLVHLQKEGKYPELVDALKDRCLTWKHLFLVTKEKAYAILAKKDAESMLEIAKSYNLKDKLDTSYFRIAEVAMLFEDYQLAISNYKKAIKFFGGHPAEKGDFRYHLGEALYRNGQKKEGKKTILQGVREIRENSKGIDPFLIHVWESGAYMRMAELLSEDEHEESRIYFDKAKKIIYSDPKLVIRKRQLEELGKRIGFK